MAEWALNTRIVAINVLNPVHKKFKFHLKRLKKKEQNETQEFNLLKDLF